MSTLVDDSETVLLGEGRPRDPAEEARAKLELRSRLFGEDRDEHAAERYRLLRRIGQGGAGAVYEGWDAELGRRVAIKILHPRFEATVDQSRARARLMREAQAIARLADPHVVGVFDVGRCTDGMARVLGPAALGGVFVVMEYVEGETLRAWAKRRPPLRDIVRAMVAAGRGLAAAHERGIVHRDFKPSNVAFGADGRVRVLDFGLARAIGSAAEVTGETEKPVLDDLTGSGLALGTPPYMAPEQHRGQDIGPAADQYALCVSLWELAAGERPFRGSTSSELLDAKLAGPPARPRLSKWLDAVLRRGLSVDPRERFDSMRALVAALERGLRRRTRATLLAVVTVTVASAVALGAWGRDLQERRDCDDGAVAKVWNDDEAAVLREAFVTSERPDALDSWARTRAHFDAYASELAERRERACRAGEPGPLVCLETNLQRLRAAVAIAGEADPDLATHALDLAIELPPLVSCQGAEASHHHRASDRALDRTIVRAEALLVAGRLDEAAATIADPAALAVRVGDDESSARLALVAGKILERRGGTRPEEAEERFRTALVTAERAGLDALALDALVQLVHVVGPVAGRFAEADDLAAQAAAKLERLGRPREPAAALAMELGLLRYRQLRNEEALAAYDEALRLRRALFGGEHPKVARVRVEIGNVLLRKAEYAEARDHFDNALSIVEHAFGSDHPSVAGPLNGLALTMQATGDVQGSLAPLQRSLAIARSSAGARHDSVAVALSNLGLAYGQLERDTDALDAIDEALSIRLELFGEEHVAVARTRSNRAGPLRRLGRFDEAQAELRAALAIFEAAMGPESAAVGAVELNLADLVAARGDHEAALVSRARAVAILEQHNDLDPDGLTKARLGLAQAQIATGRGGQAVAGLERVLAAGAPAHLTAIARVMLAEAIAAEDPSRARELASRARAWFTDSGELAQADAIDAMMDAWPDEK